MTEERLLGAYRVLDLTDEKGFLCGKMLADLGADVIKLDGPGADSTGNIGPYCHHAGDTKNPEKSLYWLFFNAGKRSITLDIETEPGRDIFKRLVKTVDIVVESFPPGYLDSLQLGYSSLKEVNPGLIYTSITPFGANGPYRDYLATDLVATAMSGFMYLTGESDRAPLRISYPQAYQHAGAQAAVGSLTALYHREITHEGQSVDISMQHSMVASTLNAVPFWELNGRILNREGAFRGGLSSSALQRLLWPCKDGWVSFVVMGGQFGKRTNVNLVEWMGEEGLADDFMKGIDWDAFDMATVTQEFHDKMESRIQNFFSAHTKQELYDGANQRQMMLFPVCSPEDIASDSQLSSREFWVELDYRGNKLRAPGPFIKCSGTPLNLNLKVPCVGEHNQEVYAEQMGISSDQLETLKRSGVI
ncbi:CaiB/BaiF CoA transferase family protein [Chloroflexota bacterium]